MSLFSKRRVNRLNQNFIIANISKYNFANLRMKRQESTIGAAKESKYGH
jgi:hypothetical protein